jgi:hypothetical protein
MNLAAVSRRHGEQRKASQILVLKQMRILRHRGRSAKQQDKPAAGGRESISLVRDREACRVHWRKCGQVLNGKQRDPNRQLAGTGEDLKVCADRAGKRVAVKMVKRCCVVLPIVRTGLRSSLSTTFFIARDGGPSRAESHQWIAGAGYGGPHTMAQEYPSGKCQIAPPLT